MFKEEKAISKKGNFVSQAPIFLSLRKPGLYILRLFFFFVPYHELFKELLLILFIGIFSTHSKI